MIHVSGCYIFGSICQNPSRSPKWPFSYIICALPNLSGHVCARPTPVEPRANDIRLPHIPDAQGRSPMRSYAIARATTAIFGKYHAAGQKVRPGGLARATTAAPIPLSFGYVAGGTSAPPSRRRTCVFDVARPDCGGDEGENALDRLNQTCSRAGRRRIHTFDGATAALRYHLPRT